MDLYKIYQERGFMKLIKLLEHTDGNTGLQIILKDSDKSIFATPDQLFKKDENGKYVYDFLYNKVDKIENSYRPSTSFKINLK